MQQSTRLRCDPTEYARKQQEKRDRAKDLRDQRQRGFCSDEHTFAPKVNPRAPASPASNREERESNPTNSQPRSFDDTPIRPSKSSVTATRKEPSPEDVPIRTIKRQPAGATASSRIPAPSSRHGNNNHADDEEEADSLDALSRRFPKKKAPPSPDPADLETAPLEPEHDTLFREVKRATGKELDDLPIKKSTGPPPGRHTGPCLRNSSCGCPQCLGGGGGSVGVTSSSNFGGGSGMRAEPLVRRRQSRAASPPDDDPYTQQPQLNSARSYGTQSDMESSLTLLKSKMSRRKSRSAPTNPSASLFIEKTARAHSSASSQQPRYSQQQQQQQQVQPNSRSSGARAPPDRQAPPQPPPRRANPSGSTQSRAHPARNDHDDDEDGCDDAPMGNTRYPPPISSGQTNDMDEYGGDQDDLIQCGNCSRRFNAMSLAKHQKICEKVFTGQRKVFNMTAKRLEGTEAEKIAAKAKASGGGGGKKVSATEKPIKAKGADWKLKSEMFRNAMKASRDVTKALKEGKELPPVAPSAPDPSLIQCEFCTRRFNEKAAERHIPFCREKSQRMNGAGPPKKGGAAAAPAAKPSRAPARKK